VISDLLNDGWELLTRRAAIGASSRRGRRFARIGPKTAICFPVAALFGERYIEIGDGCIIGPYVGLSAGVSPEHEIPAEERDGPVVRIGDRTVIGRGSSVVGHRHVRIGDDVWTGPNVYISDANHGYEDVSLPIGLQFAAPRPVTIGDGAWLGTNAVVLPGASVGRHVVVGAGSVVTTELPDFCVAVGNPARVIRRYDPDRGWLSPEDYASQAQAQGDS
jgi:acetyltransferase-like isoleucine patch superfamily enzyme